MAKLTDKQELFAREYLSDLNATQAAKRAGYSDKTAYSIGQENLKKPEIQGRIAELNSERMKRTKVDADYVLRRLVEIDQMDVLDILNDSGDLKPICDWPPVWRTTLSGLDIQAISGEEGTAALMKKIKWPDKVKNLELLGKHVTVQAFKEQVSNEHSGNVGINLDKSLSELFDDDSA